MESGEVAGRGTLMGRSVIIDRGSVASVIKPCFGCTENTDKVLAMRQPTEPQWRLFHLCDECFAKVQGHNQMPKLEVVNVMPGDLWRYIKR